MPCLAKKDEITWDGRGDVDAVLTTREVERMLKSFFIKTEELQEEEFDNPLGMGSGAGVIFGATGGVMEAALRTAYELITGKELKKLEFEEIRGAKGIKKATVQIGDKEVKVAVAHGLSNARKIMEEIKNGTSDYQFAATSTVILTFELLIG